MKTKFAVVWMLATSSCAFAQEKADVIYQTSGAVGVSVLDKGSRTPILGAPYSATTSNESVQILADGNRIVQSSTGTTARDSQGRTRRDTQLPTIGNMSASDAPRLVFILDPVAQKFYTLNLTAKTAHNMPMPMFDEAGLGAPGVGERFFVQMGDKVTTTGSEQGGEIMVAKKMTADAQKIAAENEHVEVSTEDLGTQTMEGVVVRGVRTTKTIPAGKIGNEKPIAIVTEVWTSPELNIIVSSKRSDPRMGEQTFQLTNIVRAEPDPALFTVPADFRIVEGPQPVTTYRLKQ